MNQTQWILMPLLSAGIAIISWVVPVQSAQLKDIRIGEYETYTRIVLEFDQSIDSQKITSHPQGLLTIQLSDVEPDLTRKIPTNSIRCIQTMQIRYQATGLVIFFKFIHDHLRFSSFKLEDPPRIAFDVQFQPTDELHELDEKDQPKQTTIETAPELTPKPNDSPPPLPMKATTPNPLDQSNSKYRSESNEQQQIADNQSAAIKIKDIVPSAPQKTTVSQKTTGIKQTTGIDEKTGGNEKTPSAMTVSKTNVTQQTVTPKYKGIQYFLIIGFVVLTIVILILLLIMLLTKNKWMVSATQLNVNKYLKR